MLILSIFKTDKKGQFTRKFPLGFSYFYATHDGYFPTEMGAYINFQRNYVMIELEKNKTIEEPIIAPTKEDGFSTAERFFAVLVIRKLSPDMQANILRKKWKNKRKQSGM